MKPILILLLSLPLFASVVTQKLTQGHLSQKQSFNGTLEFNEKSRLASESEGIITKLYFDEGDHVKKGQLLLEIDAQILDTKIEAIRASIKEAELSLEKAKRDYKRYARLLEQQSVSQQKYDEFYFEKVTLEQKVRSLISSLKAQEIARAKKKPACSL